MENESLIAECTAYDYKVMLEESKPKSWLKSVSAFSNGLGGSLFFGYLLKLLNRATIDNFDQDVRPENVLKGAKLNQYNKNSGLINVGRLASAGLAGYGSSVLGVYAGQSDERPCQSFLKNPCNDMARRLNT